MIELYPIGRFLVRCPHCHAPIMVVEYDTLRFPYASPICTDGQPVPIAAYGDGLAASCDLVFGTQPCCGKPYFFIIARLACAILSADRGKTLEEHWVAVGRRSIWTMCLHETWFGIAHEHWIGPFAYTNPPPNLARAPTETLDTASPLTFAQQLMERDRNSLAALLDSDCKNSARRSSLTGALPTGVLP